MVSPCSTQSWTNSDADDLLYGHVLLLSLAPLNLLNPAEGREQNKHKTGGAQYVYSAVVVYIHPGQALLSIEEAMGFL